MSLVGIAIAGLAACCWGLVYATSQELLKSDFTPVQLLIATYYMGSVAFFPVFLAHYKDLAAAEHEPYRLFFFFVVLLTSMLLVFWSVQLMGGTEASLVQVSYPVWTAIDVYISLGVKPNRLTIIGAIFILCGVGYIALYGGKATNDPQSGEEREQIHESEKGPLNNYSTIQFSDT